MTLLEGASITGQFDFASMPSIGDGLFLNLEYSSTDVTVSVEELVGLMQFGSSTSFGIARAPTDAKMADLDNDGDLDLVMTLPGADASSPGELAVFLNAGVDTGGDWLGFSSPALQATVDEDPNALDVGYLNGDLWLDVVVANEEDESISVFLNAADGSGDLALLQTYWVTDPAYTMSIGRDDGSHACNVAVAAANRVRYFVNNGSGALSQSQVLSIGDLIADLALKDIDADNDDDLLVLEQGEPSDASDFRVLTFSAGQFGSSVSTNVGLTSVALDLSDLNDDSYIDVIVRDESEGKLHLILNNDALPGQFLGPLALAPSNELGAIAVADLDNEGDPDVAVIANDGGGEVARLIRNDFNGSQLMFATAVDIGTSGDPVLVLAGDLDGDSLTDLIVVNDDSGGRSLRGVSQANIEVRLAGEDTTPPCPADIMPQPDGDGQVSIADINAVLSAYGQPCAGCFQDIVPPGGDNQVTIADINAVLSAFGPCQ
jgi:hypothetical protein